MIDLHKLLSTNGSERRLSLLRNTSEEIILVDGVSSYRSSAELIAEQINSDQASISRIRRAVVCLDRPKRYALSCTVMCPTLEAFVPRLQWLKNGKQLLGEAEVVHRCDASSRNQIIKGNYTEKISVDVSRDDTLECRAQIDGIPECTRNNSGRICMSMTGAARTVVNFILRNDTRCATGIDLDAELPLKQDVFLELIKHASLRKVFNKFPNNLDFESSSSDYKEVSESLTSSENNLHTAYSTLLLLLLFTFTVFF